MSMWFTAFIAVSIDWIFFANKNGIMQNCSPHSLSNPFSSLSIGWQMKKIKKNRTSQRVIEFCDFTQKNPSLQRSSIYAWWFVYQLHNAEFNANEKTRIANSTGTYEFKSICVRYIHWHSFN